MLSLAEQIDRIEDIKKLFITEYVSFMKPAGRPPVQTPIRTIHKNSEYMIWKAEIEAEIDLLPQNQLIEDIRKLFTKIDNGWNEEVDFDKLSAKLKALRSRLPSEHRVPVQDDESRYQEYELNQSILHALINIQKTQLYHGQSEDDINDGVRNALDMVYEIKDQTRQGESESGKKSGELDILLCKNSMPWAIVEALKLSSLEKDNLDKHINKALTKYDPVGCKNVYVLIYAMAVDFNLLWTKIVAYMKDYKYPFEIIDSFEEVIGDYAESKMGCVGLDRNGILVKLHLYVVNMR